MSFRIQGWCPGALRPMESGDGLVVRIRPRLARLTAAEGQALAQAALAHGNGLIEVTARGNLQLRGVTRASHPALLADLGALGLIDASEAEERHRNVLVTPFWAPGDGTDALAEALYAALAKGPDLPGKFGFALDVGPVRLLAGASADIRIERGGDGLILRPDGASLGQRVTPETAVAEAMRLAEWFAASGGIREGRGRMAAHLRHAAPPLTLDTPPAPEGAAPEPGLRAKGALVALEFGILRAEVFSDLARAPLRITPWRMLLVEGATRMPQAAGLIAEPADPRLRVLACTGAPGCPQALQKTRGLARRLAPAVPPGQRLHVSGCAKGCACPGTADLVLTGTPKGFALIRNGRAGDAALSVLPADQIDPELLKAPL